MSIKIKKIEIKDLPKAVDVLNHIPEFDSIFYSKIISKKLKGTEHVILLAEYAGKPVGCKIAYNRYFDGSLYSWLGGVLPPFREQGIASALLYEFEKQALKMFFKSIKFKTRNCHVAMLCFALKNGFRIIGFVPKPDVISSRIELEKNISPNA
jgi:GNAT superfamily N-acetyltransferase